MTDLKITTVNDFDEGGILPLRTVRRGDSVRIQTPTSANVIGKLNNHEELNPDSRGVNELYRTVGGDDLDEAMGKAGGGKINSDLQKQHAKTGAHELNITFTKYKEASTLSPPHAAYLVDFHAAYSDIITVPLMPKLVREINGDLTDGNYRSLKKSIVAFLNQAEDRHPDLPVMGLIPRVGRVFVNDLLDLYEDYDILAYAFDFDRCKVTTGDQLSMVQPVMQNIASRGIEEHVLTYAINASAGRVDQDIGARPAADISAFGLGIDIVGGQHVPFRADAETFEEMEASEDEEVQFRLFDRKKWVYNDIPISDLPDHFPNESRFSAEQVVERVQNAPKNGKSRLQHVINGELKALAAADLRQNLTDGHGFDSIREKTGLTEQAANAFEATREEFDDERFQSGLGEFS